MVLVFDRCHANLPALGQRFPSADDQTSTNSATNCNHGDVTGFETTVQASVRAIVVSVEGGRFASADDASVVCGLLSMMAVLGIR